MTTLSNEELMNVDGGFLGLPNWAVEVALDCAIIATFPALGLVDVAVMATCAGIDYYLEH